MWRSLRSYLYHACNPSPRKWYPMLAVCYLTYACDFRCPYCSDGAGQPYWRQSSPVLDGPEMLQVLTAIRRSCDHLVLTGGEPLQYPGLGYLLERLARLWFQSTVLTTNGYSLGPHLDAINQAIRHLVISIDSLDHERADSWYGVGAGALQEILDNLERASSRSDRKYQIIISSVATPDNLDDLFEVYRFARERGLTFAVCPQLEGVKAPPELQESETYRRLYDLLIADKKQGRRIYGSVRYLQYMRDFTSFRCRPSTLLTVTPNGEVLYPCLEIGHGAGSLLGDQDLHQLRARAIARYGPEPDCDNRCHSACALGLALSLSHPASGLHELWLAIKSLARR
jgi:MoaA/NifB/PqqE/SkfB family radical SAM enzyme